jgi:glycosyltransferase involved in cell wall biosynthesis
MVERFNLIAKNEHLDFEAWFNDKTQSDRSWVVDESKWFFRYRYMKTTVFAGKRIHYPLPLVKGRRPDVLVSLYAEPSFLFGWAIAKLKGVSTGFWIEKTFDRWVQREKWKEAFKRWLFPRVDFIVTVGENGREYALRYGAPRKRIFFAPHTIDVAHYRDKCNAVRSKRSLLHDELGAKLTTFIYVGRLLKLKGLEYLLDAFSEVQRRNDSEVCLILVGDGADEELFRYKCEKDGIRNVIFVGFVQKNELPKMYACADVFVFPTLGDPYGLVIDEAMACSLPVISTSEVGEIGDRVEDGINGYIVPPENSHDLAEAMLKLARDTNLRRSMGNVSAKKILGHTPEKWAEDFEKIVFSMLARS